MYFELIGGTERIETIATGPQIRQLDVLIEQATAQDQAIPRLNPMPNQDEHAHFVICIRNDGCDDLEIRKLYPVLEDESAKRSGFIRIIDESGEDYLYPSGNFLVIELPQAVEETLSTLTTR